jgi:hypothetical protein
MVYINENSSEVRFPRVSNSIVGKVKFINQTTKKAFELAVQGTANGLAYNIDITPIIDEFESGQYEYTLLQADGSVIDGGILQYGEFNPSTISYNTKPNYIQYNP